MRRFWCKGNLKQDLVDHGSFTVNSWNVGDICCFLDVARFENEFTPNDRVYICWWFFSSCSKYCRPMGDLSRAWHRLPNSSSSRCVSHYTFFLLDRLFVVIFLFDNLQEDFIGMGKASLKAISRHGMGNSFDDCSDVLCVEGSWICSQRVFIWLVLDLTWSSLVEDGIVDVRYGKSMGNYSLYHHFYILRVGEDTHTKTGQRWISARKPIHNNEICGGSKEGRPQVNTHSCSLYTGTHLGNHKIFPLFSLLARLSEHWSQSCPASPRHTSGHWRQQSGLCQFPPVLPFF